MTGGRIRNRLRAILNPGRSKLEDLQGALERWEELVAKYKNSKDRKGAKRDLPEDVLMAVLESLVPSDLELHLQPNASKPDTYEAMRTEIVTYEESKTGAKIKEGNAKRSRRRSWQGCGPTASATESTT